MVDEGQDFARGWLDSLFPMLTDPEHDVLYVFHDPDQALYREDVVATIGLPAFNVDWNCRNLGPIHRFASRYVPGLASAGVLCEEGRDPEFMEATPGHETIEVLRKVLHRLRVEEGLPPWQIAVLTVRSLAHSEVWRQRRFGNEILWNGPYDDAGRSPACQRTPRLTSRPTRSCATRSVGSRPRTRGDRAGQGGLVGLAAGAVECMWVRRERGSIWC